MTKTEVGPGKFAYKWNLTTRWDTYFIPSARCLSFNEGGRWFNFHVNLKNPYLYLALLVRSVVSRFIWGGGLCKPQWLPRIEFEVRESDRTNRFALVVGSSHERLDQMFRKWGNCHFFTV